MTISSVYKNVGEHELMHIADGIKLYKYSRKWLLDLATPLPDTNKRNEGMFPCRDPLIQVQSSFIYIVKT